MDRSEALLRLNTSDVGHLATVRPDGTPHLVPITYGVADNHIVTMVDHKPKTTTRLQRLANVESSGTASFLVDHYTPEWDGLWWVRIDGAAEVHHHGPIWENAASVLAEKYFQYRERPPTGPAISISIDKLSYWASTP